MIGGLMKRGSIFAVAAAASIFSTNAMAADLGGDCCADLEERVAELEATTARKGNRKVSLTISVRSTNWSTGGMTALSLTSMSAPRASLRAASGSRARPAINAEWSAGYYIEIEVVSAQVSSTTASDDDGRQAIALRHSAWYLKSKRLGSFWVGQHSHATDNIVLYANGGTGAATAANYNVAPGANITFRGLEQRRAQ